MTWISKIPDPDGSFSRIMLSKLQQEAQQHAASYTWEQQAIDIQQAVDNELGATSGENIWLSPCFESGIPNYDTVKSYWDWKHIRSSSLRAPGPIHIDARALRALQVCGYDATHGGKRWESWGHCEARSDAIMHKLLQIFPAALWILQTAGVDPNKIPTPDMLSSPGRFTTGSISDIFRGQAHGRHAAHPIVPTGAKAMLSSRLTIEDLFLSAIESSFQDNKYYTDAARVILEGFGLDDEKSFVIDSDGCDRLREIHKLARHLHLLAPETDTQQVILFLDEHQKVVVRPFGHYGLGFVGEPHLPSNISLPHRIAVIQPPHVISPTFEFKAIIELQDMINSRSATEHDFQLFFEAHPEFLIGIDYKRVHPQVTLHREEAPDLRPDFFLETPAGMNDVLDIKLPYSEMVRRLGRGNRVFFRTFVEEAKAQMLEYRRYFDDRHNRENFRKTYGLSVYRPKMVIVVGRQQHFKDEFERSKLSDTLPKDLCIWTYDELVKRAENYWRLASGSK